MRMNNAHTRATNTTTFLLNQLSSENEKIYKHQIQHHSQNIYTYQDQRL